ncbi:hypothetical protein L5I01_29705 [Gordonia sp. HY442]|uniref:hypothetical protein n=1 Tax=Gordonia zhenghanii TaxID=2911516 RepID=UPI001F304CC4|nr:hypothetical protein [Gordonia zhenghanii]MCF8607540.1 hypothetical protein [Gordonia zhenghanii]
MTEHNTTETTDETIDQEAPDTGPDATETDQTEVDQEQGVEQNPSRREAGYRVKLREAEAQRDQLSERLTSLQRAEVERIAAGKIKSAQALWASGAELADLLAEDGTVDGTKVIAAAERARDQLGLEAPRPPLYVPKEGQTTGPHRRPSGWEEAFIPA